MTTNDQFRRRIEAQCQSKADRKWMDLDKDLGKVMRIAMAGPEFEDAEFVKSVFVLIGYELVERRRLRKENP